MSPYERINPYRGTERPPFRRTPPRSPWRRRVSAALPWVFVLGIAVGSTLPIRQYVPQWMPLPSHWSLNRSRDAEMIRQRGGTPDARHAVDVVRTIDGDTFEARVHLAPGPDLYTRVRLRGIDAPELKASCARELQMAQAATVALRDLLGEGDVAIYNIGSRQISGSRRRRRRDQED
ncbi:hypothetical protein ACVILK_004784 [Bradyrhizobium embrapense]